jgi:hypothetical protein
MDIFCPKCGEPWDNDELHEVVAERHENGDHDASYNSVAREFRGKGCEVFGCSHGHVSAMAAELAAVAYDMMGDDMDGAASMLDDAQYFGLI